MSTSAPGPDRPRRSWPIALLLLRCPRCREGRIFKSTLAMNDPCPVCGLVFEREPGYFLGAMYFSYGLAIVLAFPLYFLARWIFPTLDDLLLMLVALVPFLLVVPVLFRYSRVMWIYFDRGVSPTELSTHEGWMKWRERNRPGGDA